MSFLFEASMAASLSYSEASIARPDTMSVGERTGSPPGAFQHTLSTGEDFDIRLWLLVSPKWVWRMERIQIMLTSSGQL